MTPAEFRSASAELELARQRRELLFWTITITLMVTILIAMSIAFLLSLVSGSSLDPTMMGAGAGITGTSAAASHLLRLLRHHPPPGNG